MVFKSLNQGKIRAWYKNPITHYNILPLVRNRTVDFITPRKIVDENDLKRIAFRYLKIKGFSGINFNIEEGEVVDHFRNIYTSVATLSDDFPGIDIVDRQNEKNLREEYNEKFANYVTGYDLVIDLDNEDLNVALEETKRIIKIFDELQVPYYVVFSGNKGFHVKVPYANLKCLNVRPIDMPEYFERVIKNFSKVEDLPSVDDRIYTLGRVIKLPYSIERHKDLVCLPLDKEQIENFSVDKMQLDYILMKVRLKNRGLLIRTGTNEGVIKFFDKYTPKEEKVSEIESEPKKKGFFSKIKQAWKDGQNE